MGKVSIDRLAEIAPACRGCRLPHHGWRLAFGMEMDFHLLCRAGYDEHFPSEIARTMEYAKVYSSEGSQGWVSARTLEQVSS